MSEKDITRWNNTITPRDKAPLPWTLGSGGSWDMQEVQPIPDAMLSELAQRYHYAGTPWNCRSMPLSAGDREYMYLLYSSMQGLVARMRMAEREAAEATATNEELAMMVRMLASSLKRHWPHVPQPGDLPSRAVELLRTRGLLGSPLRDEGDGPAKTA